MPQVYLSKELYDRIAALGLNPNVYTETSVRLNLAHELPAGQRVLRESPSPPSSAAKSRKPSGAK